MDRDQIFDLEGIFLDVELTGSPKVHDAVLFEAFDHLADSVKFGAGSVVDQISQLNGIIRPAVIRQYHR